MPKYVLSKESFAKDKGGHPQNQDWYGNNIAITCPVCGKVYLTSQMLAKGRRNCPQCGKSSVQATKDEAVVEWDERSDQK